MGDSSLWRHAEPIAELGDSPPSTDHRYAAALLAVIGLCMLIVGPTLALLMLFLGVDAPTEQAGALATVHGLGIVAGLVGGALLVSGSAWWLLAMLLRRRTTRRKAV